jgi:tRNA (guanine37-N1)-methyltransferase
MRSAGLPEPDPNGLLMRVDILTLFPGIFRGFLEEGTLRIAIEKGLVDVRLRNFRDFATDARKTVDDKPFGGGPGMLIKPEPVFDCLEAVVSEAEAPKPRMVLLSPRGARFDQKLARELSRESRLLLLCGRYEGFDERIKQGWPFEEISIGDCVLSGGEPAAMVILDAVTRLIPGVLGHDLSAESESFEGDGLLDYPQYTRPASYRGMEVPDVLRSGDHSKIAAWRRQRQEQLTKSLRPDLLD